MRIAVLDVGSCSAHLCVAETRPDGAFRTVASVKARTRLADAIRRDGSVGPPGADRLVRAVAEAVRAARSRGVHDLVPFATSAIRDAPNRKALLDRVDSRTGVRLGWFTGEDEARLTYAAARRWHDGDGPLLVLDIGGGTMEIAYGTGTWPDFATSLSLGARQLTDRHLPRHPAPQRHVERLREHVGEALAPAVAALGPLPHDVTALATSRTFAQLARLSAGRRAATADVLHRAALPHHIERLAKMSPRARARLRGVSRPRAVQILAGAVVADVLMESMALPRVTICPWGLREGVLLEHLAGRERARRDAPSDAAR